MAFLLSGAATAAGYVINAKEKARQFELLLDEIEDVKVLLGTTKNAIDDGLKSNLNLCSLGDLIDAVNAFQEVFARDFLPLSGRVQAVAWPDFFRNELQMGVRSVEYALHKHTMELNAYTAIVLQRLIAENPGVEPSAETLWAEIRKELREKNTECARIALFLKAKTTWDICPTCAYRSSERQTPAERFAQQQKKAK